MGSGDWKAGPHPARGFPVVFSPDGQFLAVGVRGIIRLYVPETGERVRDVDIDASNVLSFARDGTLLTVGDDKAVRLYSSATGNPIRTLDVSANAAAFSPDSQRIVVASPDKTVRVIDVTGNH